MSSQQHVKYFLKKIEGLSFNYVGVDTTRMSCLYFSVVALDIMNSGDLVGKEKIASFVYENQIPLKNIAYGSCGDTSLHNETNGRAGFVGSNYLAHNVFRSCGQSSTGICGYLSDENAICHKCSDCRIQSVHYIQGHLAMTYTALAILLTISDDLSGVHSAQIIDGKSDI